MGIRPFNMSITNLNPAGATGADPFKILVQIYATII